MHDTAKRSAYQGLSQKRSVGQSSSITKRSLPRANAGGYERYGAQCAAFLMSILETLLEATAAYDRGDTDGPAYWTAIVGRQELGLSRDQIATLIKLDSESITRPNQGAVQWQAVAP